MTNARDVQEGRLALAGGRVAGGGGMPCPAAPCGGAGRTITRRPGTSASREV